MRVDGVARPALDLLDHGPQAPVVHLGRPAAALADHVVVVGGLAEHIGVLAVGHVQAFDQAQVQEHLERPEDRRPTDGQAASPALPHELWRGEMTFMLGHHRGHQPTWLGAQVPRAIERGKQWFDGCHAVTIAPTSKGPRAAARLTP